MKLIDYITQEQAISIQAEYLAAESKKEFLQYIGLSRTDYFSLISKHGLTPRIIRNVPVVSISAVELNELTITVTVKKDSKGEALVADIIKLTKQSSENNSSHDIIKSVRRAGDGAIAGTDKILIKKYAGSGITAGEI